LCYASLGKRLPMIEPHRPGGGTAYYTLQYAYIGMGEFGFEPDGQWFRFPFHEPGRRIILKAHGRGILRAGGLNAD